MIKYSELSEKEQEEVDFEIVKYFKDMMVPVSLSRQFMFEKVHAGFRCAKCFQTIHGCGCPEANKYEC